MQPKRIKRSRAVASLLEVLKRVPDRRSRHGRRYPLHAVLALVTVATLCGCAHQRAIVDFGEDQPEKVIRALGFTRGRTPCAATLHLIMKDLDVVAFERELRAWAKGLCAEEHEELRAIALDGKTMRGTIGNDVPGAHVLSAFDLGSGVVLAAAPVVGKTSEFAVASEMLPSLPLGGAVVTGDANFARRDLCKAIIESGGDYLFVVKKNQMNLYEAIERAFDPPHSPL